MFVEGLHQLHCLVCQGTVIVECVNKSKLIVTGRTSSVNLFTITTTTTTPSQKGRSQTPSELSAGTSVSLYLSLFLPPRFAPSIHSTLSKPPLTTKQPTAWISSANTSCAPWTSGFSVRSGSTQPLHIHSLISTRDMYVGISRQSGVGRNETRFRRMCQRII